MGFRLATGTCLTALGLAAAAAVGAQAQTGQPQTGQAQTGQAQTGQAQTGTAPAASPPSASAPATAPAATATPAQADPVVAKVGDQEIHLSDLNTAAASLPPNYRSLPQQMLFPMLLERLIDQQALVDEARKTGLDKDPAVQRQVELAENSALSSALISKEIAPQLTEQAVQAQYQKQYAGKPGPEEVHAKHILVGSEAQAKDIIAQLKNGANFDELAKKYSKDSGAGDGGDLGFFKKDQMVPAFADAAFALQPGEVSPEPVHTQFGWHVIKVIEKRQDKPPTFDQVKDDLRNQMAQEAIKKAVAQARAGVKVETFNVEGSPMAATSDNATPAPAPAK